MLETFSDDAAGLVRSVYGNALVLQFLQYRNNTATLLGVTTSSSSTCGFGNDRRQQERFVNRKLCCSPDRGNVAKRDDIDGRGSSRIWSRRSLATINADFIALDCFTATSTTVVAVSSRSKSGVKRNFTRVSPSVRVPSVHSPDTPLTDRTSPSSCSANASERATASPSAR